MKTGDRIRISAGERRRREILERAMAVASTDGLEGLTIGRLASALGMSKSGLIAHFGSKQELQLATVEAAALRFAERVLKPVTAAAGLARLAALLESWTAYVEGDSFAGGCFFWAASAEFDGRPGPVRNRIAELTGSWLKAIEEEATLARKLGELDADSESGQLAFEAHAFVQEANWAYQLFGDVAAFGRARAAIRSLLERARPARRSGSAVGELEDELL